MDKLSLAKFMNMFESVSSVMSDNCEYLCQLDAKMGDGDLGLTMKRGFEAVVDSLKTGMEETLDKTLMKAGMKMSSIAPSTMGTLMASGLMSGGKLLAGKTEIGAEEYAAFLTGFCDGIIKRGKCAEGDRTILDAISPAAKAASETASAGAGLAVTATASKEGAVQGMESTRAMVAKFGKPAVFKEKVIGEPDQGAVAGMLFVSAMADYISAN